MNCTLDELTGETTKVPWRLTDEFQSVCVDSITEANNRFYKYKDSARLPVAERSEASTLIHPSRLFSRPYLKYGDLLESHIRLRLERPIIARLTSFYWANQRKKFRSSLPKGFRATSLRAVMEMLESINSRTEESAPPDQGDNATPPPFS